MPEHTAIPTPKPVAWQNHETLGDALIAAVTATPGFQQGDAPRALPWAHAGYVKSAVDGLLASRRLVSRAGRLYLG